MTKETKLLCPCCEKPLVYTHSERYEDLSEHVSNPNGTPSMKDAFQCANEYCIANNLNASWIADGECYIKPPEGIKWTTAHRMIEKASVSGMYWALGSWNHYYQKGLNNIKKKTFTIDLRKWKIKVSPLQKGHKHPTETQYEPHLWKREFEYLRREDDRTTYVYVTPALRMVRFCLGKFKREYKQWNETGDKRSLENCYKEIMSITSWGTPDDRAYAKITSWVLRYFYPIKSSKIKTAHLITNAKTN